MHVILAGVHFNFSQAEMCNGLKSVGTICYRAYGSGTRSYQSHRLDHIFPRGISIPCEKLKCTLLTGMIFRFYLCNVQMKKVFTIALSLIFFAVSSGIIINMHYCMGKRSGVSYRATAASHCGKCGMDNTGCCHDDVQLVKLSNDQQPVASCIAFSGFDFFSGLQRSGAFQIFRCIYFPHPCNPLSAQQRGEEKVRKFEMRPSDLHVMLPVLIFIVSPAALLL